MAGPAERCGEQLGGSRSPVPLPFTFAWLIAWPGARRVQPSTWGHQCARGPRRSAELDHEPRLPRARSRGRGARACAPERRPTRPQRRIRAALLALAGLGILVAGPARNDCSSELGACRAHLTGDLSWHHHVHDLVSVLAFLSLAVAQLVLARAFHVDDHWRDLAATPTSAVLRHSRCSSSTARGYSETGTGLRGASSLRCRLPGSSWSGYTSAGSLARTRPEPVS